MNEDDYSLLKLTKMQTNELKQKITEVFMSFEEFPEANTELFVDDILDLFKKEYEEKLRWIPVEEKLPEIIKTEPTVSKVVQVRSKNFQEPFCAFYNHLHNIWLHYPFGSNSQILGITEWRYFL